MPVANVGSKWIAGVLHFFDKATGTSILSLNASGDVELGTSQFLKNQTFTVQLPRLAAADIGLPFFVAPAACEVVAATERHVTVAGQAGTLTIEKCTAAEAPGAGDVVLASAFDLTSTANTNVTKSSTSSGVEQMAAGDALCTKLASGAATSYAGASMTVTLKWL